MSVSLCLLQSHAELSHSVPRGGGSGPDRREIITQISACTCVGKSRHISDHKTLLFEVHTDPRTDHSKQYVLAIASAMIAGSGRLFTPLLSSQWSSPLMAMAMCPSPTDQARNINAAH